MARRYEGKKRGSMSAFKTWRAYPLYTIVAEILERKSSITDEDLLEAVREYYRDASFSDINRILMRMEISGLITVSTLMRGKRLIELRRKL